MMSVDIKSIVDKTIADFAKETHDKVMSQKPITEIPTECHPKEHHFVTMSNIRDEMMCVKCFKRAKVNVAHMTEKEEVSATQNIQDALNDRN